MLISIIIPTLNAEKELEELLKVLRESRCSFETEIIVIDSSSSDNTIKVCKKNNVKSIVIPKENFNHGGTRNIASLEAKGDILVFLTQDALPVNENSINHLISPIIENQNIGMAYGRQIPYSYTNEFGRFARLFNYPAESRVKTISDLRELGIKTIFTSNSFAAYRKNVLRHVGGFPTNVILGEDTFVAAKILKEGYAVAYQADATVYHSHSYNIIQEFKRYFDTGAFHSHENWIIEEFAKADSEGMKYIIAELSFLIKNNKSYLIPSAMVRNISKYLGYKLGLYEKYIPNFMKRKVSMHKFYWK